MKVEMVATEMVVAAMAARLTRAITGTGVAAATVATR